MKPLAMFSFVSLVAVLTLASGGWGSRRSGALTVAALLEASEFCRPGDGNRPADAARAGAGTEALSIAAETVPSVSDRGLQEKLAHLIDEQTKRCSHLASGHLAEPGTPDELIALAIRLHLTAARRDELVTPYVSRLNLGATKGVERLAERETTKPAADGGQNASRPIVESASVEAGEPAGLVRDPEFRTAKKIEKSGPTPGRAVIDIRRSSAEYHRRIARWQRVFRREVDELRVARAKLQDEIRALSLAQATSACRGFLDTVNSLSGELAKAPSRGLSIRIDRMVDFYRAGAEQCSAGRPISAFSLLSEGDREWTSVARLTAHLLRPRSLRAAPAPVGSPPEKARPMPAH